MEKYGPKAIVLDRFVPIVRTFAPIVAGAGRMKYRTFLSYNIIGGIAWGTGVTLAGYWLGQIEFIRTNVESILILIVLLSVVPIIIEFLRERSKKKREAAQQPTPQPQFQAPQQHMDDATTQLRRIPQADAQQQPYNNGDGQYYGRQQPPQQQQYGGGYYDNNQQQYPYGQQPQQPHQQGYSQNGYPQN
jgi:membrane-associated protein